MGAPKFKVSQQKKIQAKSPDQEMREVEHLTRKIQEKLKDEKERQKAAKILELLINGPAKK